MVWHVYQDQGWIHFHLPGTSDVSMGQAHVCQRCGHVCHVPRLLPMFCTQATAGTDIVSQICPGGRLGQVASEDQDPGDLVALDLVLAWWSSPWQDLRHGREY